MLQEQIKKNEKGKRECEQAIVATLLGTDRFQNREAGFV